MFKGYWLRSKNLRKKVNINLGPGICISICLAFLYLSVSSIKASPSISLEKIQQMEQKSHGAVQKRYRAWAKLLEALKNKSINVQLEKVNSFFNQFRYQTSEESRGIADYWKTPDEFINDGGGDCKDYAIIKYFTLINLGVPREKLRLTYVIYLTLKQAHMVLSYYPSPEAEPLILDNLENEILIASKRPDLKPVYSFNGEGLWLQKQRNQGTSLGQPNSLGKWDDLMKRMQPGLSATVRD